MSRDRRSRARPRRHRTTFRLMRSYHPRTRGGRGLAADRRGAAGARRARHRGVESGASPAALHGQHLLPRNAQIAELAACCSAGVRAATLNPAWWRSTCLALFQVAPVPVRPMMGAGSHHADPGRRTSARSRENCARRRRGRVRRRSRSRRPHRVPRRRHDGAVDAAAAEHADGGKTRQRRVRPDVCRSM